MKRAGLFIFAVLFVLSTVSAEIIFDDEPNGIYNLGDSISVPVTVKAISEISGTIKLILICEGKQTQFFENGIELGAGEEVKVPAVLSKEKIGFQTGMCKIKGILEDEYEITDDFEISNSINVQVQEGNFNFEPGEVMIIKGNAIKQNGEDVNGFVSLKISGVNGSGNIEKLSTVGNGFFSIEVELPEDMKAGNHVVQLRVYELNSDEEETNVGFMSKNIYIEQIPTNLEIFIENKNVGPGSFVKIKTILHDQTGEKIPATSIVSLKKSKNEIVEQVEIETDEFIEFKIPYNEPPANWTVVAVSTLLDSSTEFSVLENEEVSVDVVNGTVLLTNKGNVPYNDSVLVRIGENSSLKIEVFLEVDESKEYELRAPDGEYYIEVISDGESKYEGNALLTGRAIDFKELGRSKNTFVKILVWVFLILVLGVVAFILYKKGYKKSFFGSKKKVSSHEKSLKSTGENEKVKKNSESFFDTKHKAVLSLSIKGDKHDTSVVCLKIRNMKSLKKEWVVDSFEKIVSFAEAKKSAIYENQENVFFIFSALKTKTFKNEKDAIELAKKIEEILSYHNRVFKHKVDFGVSINFGGIVGNAHKKEGLEFMAMGNLIASSKKIAGLSDGEILLSNEFRNRAEGLIRSQEKELEGVKVYTIKEVRDREQHAKFLSNFLHNLEKDKAEKERRERGN